MIKYKAIYKCRLCGLEFDEKANKAENLEYPIAALYKVHKCQEEKFGVCELMGTYEVKE